MRWASKRHTHTENYFTAASCIHWTGALKLGLYSEEHLCTLHRRMTSKANKRQRTSESGIKNTVCNFWKRCSSVFIAMQQKEEKTEKRRKKLGRKQRNRKIVHSSSGLFADKGVSMHALQTLIAATESLLLPLAHSLCVSLSASLKFMWHFLPFFPCSLSLSFWPPRRSLVKHSISNEINGSKWIRANNIAIQPDNSVQALLDLFLRTMAICTEQTEAPTFKSNTVLFLRSTFSHWMCLHVCVCASLPFFGLIRPMYKEDEPEQSNFSFTFIFMHSVTIFGVNIKTHKITTTTHRTVMPFLIKITGMKMVV